MGSLNHCMKECWEAIGKGFKFDNEKYELYHRCHSDCYQKEYDAPMVWVGLYIAGASLVCLMAFLIDLFNAFRTKKLWFPCKFFSLNAAISALLAIAMKIPSDLTTPMTSLSEQLVKLSGPALMSISLANFMPSLASMSDSELFSNLMALALLIVPLISNIIIQISTGVIDQSIQILHFILIPFILLQFSLLLSTAIASPTMKIKLNSAYKEVTSTTKASSKDDHDDLNLIEKHWVLMQTGNPQFAIARSAICTTSGAICLVIFLIAAYVIIIVSIVYHVDNNFTHFSSNYKWSMTFILTAQTAAILFGSISPICRWFTVVWFKFEGWTSKSSFTDLWTVEKYWTERLREMKDSRSRSNCRLLKLKTCNGIALFLNICIMFQMCTVISCKFLSFISLVFFLPFLCFYKMIIFLITSMKKKKKKADTQRKRDLRWELKLEKEPEFPEHTIKKIVSTADGYIKKGKKKTDSMKLIKLLNKADGFDGIQKFNLTLIQKLLTGMIMNRSWTMMVVTLSTIAVACSRECDDEFVVMVSNILPYVIYVDEIVGVGSKVDNNIIDLVDAAMVVWFDVHFFRKWLKNTNLPINKTKNNSVKENLTVLRDSSTNYTTTTTTGGDKLRVMAAERMKETVEIVLQFLEQGHDDDDLSEKISEMVADILTACLVNLSDAITIKISDTPIEKREEAVKQAACIFGETQQVQKFAQLRLSSISSSAEDHQEYVEASWWNVVIIKNTITGSKASADHVVEID